MRPKLRVPAAFAVALTAILAALTPLAPANAQAPTAAAPAAAVAVSAPAAAPALATLAPSGGGTRCAPYVASKKVCASIYQSSVYGHPLVPYGRVYLPSTRARVAKAQIAVLYCRSGVFRAAGQCDVLLSKVWYDVTRVYNNSRCASLIRGGQTWHGSLACINGGPTYSKVAGRYYVADAALYINGRYVSSSTSPPIRAGS